MKKLKDPEQSLQQLLSVLEYFGENLGPVLFQLPPRWACNIERFQYFLNHLPGGYRYAFEFRDTSWMNEEVLLLLAGANAAFCIYELSGYQSPQEITADFVYVRLHGPGKAYQGDYSDKVLQGWATRINSWLATGKDAYCYFDNDQNPYAVHNALRLREMLA